MDVVADVPAVYAQAGTVRRVRVTAVGRPLQRLVVVADLVVAERTPNGRVLQFTEL